MDTQTAKSIRAKLTREAKERAERRQTEAEEMLREVTECAEWDLPTKHTEVQLVRAVLDAERQRAYNTREYPNG